MLGQSQVNDFKFREFKMRNQDDLAKKIEKGTKENDSKQKDEESPAMDNLNDVVLQNAEPDDTRTEGVSAAEPLGVGLSSPEGSSRERPLYHIPAKVQDVPAMPLIVDDDQRPRQSAWEFEDAEETLMQATLAQLLGPGSKNDLDHNGKDKASSRNRIE